MGGVKTLWRLAALVALITGLGAVAFAGPASAADTTTWICKPGQSDDLCAGPIDGVNLPPPGGSDTPLGYTRPTDPAIDCFYLYPTQSQQETPNSNLDKDPPIRRVVVQQARMFSSRCNVYAPMYRQVTFSGNQLMDNPDVEVAYDSAKDAFEDYLENYNNGRPFVMLGHSQGSAHTVRLIDEMVDRDAQLRKRFVGASAPGANVYVPIGQNVGGMYDNVPACSEVGQYGCIVAFSTYKGYPGDVALFSRLDSGYWIYPEPRPDQTKFEVVCTNPAALDGGASDVNLEPLVNLDYLAGVPSGPELAMRWIGQPEYYKAECQRQSGAHWLNLSKLDTPGDDRTDVGSLVAEGSNYHVPEVNLTEGNLLEIVRLQTESYRADQTRATLKSLRSKLAKAKKRLAGKQKVVKVTARKLRKAKTPKRKKVLKRKLKVAKKRATAERKRVKTLKRKITRVKSGLG